MQEGGDMDPRDQKGDDGGAIEATEDGMTGDRR